MVNNLNPMRSCDKLIILAFIGNYLPGYKAGGILRITVNTVDHLCEEFEFKIITRDRDLGDHKPYPDIKINQWQQVGNAQVYYLPPQSGTIKEISNLIASTPHHILYLNSFFDPFTVKALLNRKFHKASFKPVIVAPFGEFGWASLKQKYLKKIVFIQLARLIGIYGNVTWRASSEFEKSDIVKVMKIKSDAIQIVEDLPIKNIPNVSGGISSQSSSDDVCLRIVFLSRIARGKNLDYALKVLQHVKAEMIFDIYGPAENAKYWKECQLLILQLPGNVKVNYLGSVRPDQVVDIFRSYDLFFFPSGGEAYGHVIAECLTAGTPVLLSTKTPWRDLHDEGLGWDIDLANQNSFVEVMEKMARLSREERQKIRGEIQRKIGSRLVNPRVLETNRQLFLRQL